MRITEVLKTVLNSFRINKVRFFLTMLGVIIGVFAVISLVSVGTGVEKFVSDRFNEIGSNLLLVAPGKVDFSDDPAKAFTRNKLDEKHVKLLETYVGDKIVAVSPSIRLSSQAVYKSEAHTVSVIAGNYNYLRIYDLEVDKGVFFTRNQERAKENVALLGSEIKKKLFNSADAIGNKITVGEDTFTVMGVLKAKNQRFDAAIIIPYTSASTVFNIKNFSGLAMKVRDGENVDFVAKNAQLALLRDLKDTEFSILSQADILESITNILGILTIGIASIAGISLVVGGIGIMNIMLVSVTERTAEIGLRKALGATKKDILLQFLFESCVIGLVGGGIGICLSFLLSLAVKPFIELVIPGWAIFIAFGFSLLIGIVFGTYPALNASKKDPIESLRYE
uniref:FtsX-like permease family protein n=1 Tax=candidate division WWE3 bacterium TaxID=2053526 RepID=A0A7C4XI02_UNCKA